MAEDEQAERAFDLSGGVSGEMTSQRLQALAAANPNIREQIQTWQGEVRAGGGNYLDWPEFRAHVQRLGAPDPGDEPPEEFSRG